MTSTGIVEFFTIFALAVVRRHRGDLEGSEHPAHPAHVGVNAIHGIILVGTMIVLGDAHGSRRGDPRVHRGTARNRERRRRVRRDRPDARRCSRASRADAASEGRRAGAGERPGGGTAGAADPDGRADGRPAS